QGVIRYKHIGPITPKDWEEKIGPLVAYLEKQP
ncbi:MAG TPA: DsbE family thiol:disulfide interchange protein, partial [Methylothermaceae bacterium]|nr:DsbE family thiol:disulfide interchange protein [Methylothermaceae bacterium]